MSENRGRPRFLCSSHNSYLRWASPFSQIQLLSILWKCPKKTSTKCWPVSIKIRFGTPIKKLKQSKVRHLSDASIDAGFNNIIGPSQRLDKPKLYQYHLEAHHKATQYLCTLYLTLVDNPFVGFYNPITKNQIPPKAARDAISKLDRINSRLMDRNIANDLYLGLGQIQWQRFVEIWKTTLFVLNNTRQSGEPEIEPLMLALSDMCKEYDYPSTWASLPPSGPAETHANNKIKTE